MLRSNGALALFTFFSFLLGGFIFSGCGTTTTASDDYSASGAAAGSVGSALAGSSSNGTLSFYVPAKPQSLFDSLSQIVPDAFAAGACPTIKTTGSGCASAGSNFINLTYSSCSFGSSAATWSGVMQVGASGIACGSFPTSTTTRQYVTSGGVVSTATRTTLAGAVYTVDHSTSNLGNYQSDSITTVTNGGYGNQVTFTAGARTGVIIAQRLYATASASSSTTLFDHSVVGTLTSAEGTGGTARTVTGNVTTYHNKLKVKGTATFNSVGYVDGCCLPTSGSITTAFASTSQSGIAGTALNGKSETLTFTGCGTGSLVDTSGATTTVNLSQCL